MKTRVWLFLAVALSSSLVHCQSVDEEEPAHVEHFEGSGNANNYAAPDDEDFEGSALPPDQKYATNPVVRTQPSTVGMVPASSTTTIRHTTAVIKQDLVATVPTSPPRVTTSVHLVPEPEAASTWLTSQTFLIAVIVFVVIVVLIVTIFLCCIRKKRGYTTGKTDIHDA